MPLDWAMTQNNLETTLGVLDERKGLHNDEARRDGERAARAD